MRFLISDFSGESATQKASDLSYLTSGRHHNDRFSATDACLVLNSVFSTLWTSLEIVLLSNEPRNCQIDHFLSESVFAGNFADLGSFEASREPVCAMTGSGILFQCFLVPRWRSESPRNIKVTTI